MKTAIGVGLAIISGILAGFLICDISHTRSAPAQAATITTAPAGFEDKIIDYNGKVYYTHEFAFDSAHKCIVFADQDNQHTVVCGNYKIIGVATESTD